MPASRLGPLVAPRRHAAAHLALVDDTGDIVRPLLQDDEQPPDPVRRTTWLHGALGMLGVLVIAWLGMDIAESLSDPVMRGHLRGAAPIGVSIIITLVACTYVLHRMLERVHIRNRAFINWFEARAKVIDQRDVDWRARQKEISDEHRVLLEGHGTLAEGQRALAEDVALIGRATADLSRTTPELAAAVRYANSTLNTIARQVVGIGNGQAVVHGNIEQLARVVTHLIEAPGAADRTPREESHGADEWRDYLREGNSELNEDQLRGYLMGIYDREQRADDGPESVA